MSSANRRKGKTFERDVRAFFETLGLRVIKPQEGAKDDSGDALIYTRDGTLICLEIKNEQQFRLSAYMQEAQLEAANSKADHYAAVVKRRGKGTKDSYVVMPLEEYAALLIDKGWAKNE
jgi:Holliday junction resolvase